MKKYTKFLLMSVISILFIGGLGSIGVNAQEDPIRIGSGNANPWTVEQEDGSIEGVGMVVIDELMSRLGYDYEMIMTDIPGMFGNIDSGRVDMLGLKLALTEDRQEKYAYSDVYYYDGAKLVVHEEDDSIKSMEDLKGKTVAAGEGQVSLDFIEKYKEENDPDDEIEVLIVQSGAMDATLAGHADAYIASEPNFVYRQTQQEAFPLKIVGDVLYVEESAFLFPKDVDQGFLNEFNEAIKSMQDDGFLSETFTDFFGIDTSQPIEL